MAMAPEECSIEFAREVFDRIDEIEDNISGFDTRDEALAYIVGSISTLRELTDKLLKPDAAKNVLKYIDEQEDFLEEIANKLPIDKLRTYRVIELDILRGLPGKTFMTRIEAENPNDTIKKFYELFPGSGDHLLVIKEESVIEFIKSKEKMRIPSESTRVYF